MVERQTTNQLSVILKATSEPTRRAILTLLAQEGPMRITDIHSQFTGSLNAISKHIKVLEQARLVARKTDWREHLIEIQMAPLTKIDDWFAQLRSIWEIRLDTLDVLMTTGEKNDE